MVQLLDTVIAVSAVFSVYVLPCDDLTCVAKQMPPKLTLTLARKNLLIALYSVEVTFRMSKGAPGW